MQIEAPAGGISKRYRADSNNGRALVTGDLHGEAFAKTAAATDLMQKLIPDVEEWLRQSQALHKE